MQADSTRDRRTAIIEAALETFLHYGFRRTSLQDVGRAAQMSRTALYHHFSDKEDLFRAVSDYVHAAGLEQASLILGDAPEAEPEGAGVTVRTLQDAERMLVDVLDAVLGHQLEVVLASRHGHELIDVSGRLCGDIVDRTARQHRRLLERILAAAVKAGTLDPRRVGMSVKGLVEHVLLSADGLLGPRDRLPSRAAYRRRLRNLVRITLAALSTSDAGPLAGGSPRRTSDVGS